MNVIQQVVTVLSAALPFVTGFVTFLIKFIKNEKVKKALQQTVKITEALQPLIVNAEQFSHYTGQEKKEYVLTRANQFAIENNLQFDREKISDLIDGLVETTKKVNARNKDMQNQTTVSAVI